MQLISMVIKYVYNVQIIQNHSGEWSAEQMIVWTDMLFKLMEPVVHLLPLTLHHLFILIQLVTKWMNHNLTILLLQVTSIARQTKFIRLMDIAASLVHYIQEQMLIKLIVIMTFAMYFQCKIKMDHVQYAQLDRFLA